MEKIKQVLDFLKNDIWRLPLDDLTKGKSFLVKKARILLLTFRCFNEDKCTLRASALTFYVLLSIVPIAAMAFGIAKGFGMEETLKTQLLANFSEQQEVMSKVIEFAQNMLDNTKGGMVAGVGVLLLFWTVIKVLGNIEISFNDIWGVKEPRTIARKLSDYLSMVVLAPVILLVCTSVNVFVTGFFKKIVVEYEFVAMFDGIILFGLRFLPVIFLAFFFAFIYILIPNTKVKIKPAIYGGILAGILYQLLQVFYFGAQAAVASTNPIYGSFAALPFFLVWLQVSWFILLFGAEFAYANQNVDTYFFEKDTKAISHSFKRLLSLQIVHLIVREFNEGEEPESDAKIAEDLSLPIRLVRELLNELHDACVISEIINARDNSITFQPAKTINDLSIAEVMEMLDSNGSSNIPVKQTEGIEEITESLDLFKKQLVESAHNKLIKDI